MRIKMIKFNWVLGIALLISFPLYLMALNSKLSKMGGDYKEEVRRLNEDIELLHYASLKHYQIEQNHMMLDTMTFFNENGSIHTSEIFTIKNQLCLFITKKMCNACIYNILDNLDRMSENDTFKVFIESSSIKELSLKKRTYNPKFEYYGYKSLGVDLLGGCEKPVLAVIYGNGSIKHIFIPLIPFQTRTREYLKMFVMHPA